MAADRRAEHAFPQRGADGAARPPADLDELLEELDEELRVVLVLHYLENTAPSQETAAALGLSQPTVHRRIQDGQRQLRGRIGGEESAAVALLAGAPATLPTGQALGKLASGVKACVGLGAGHGALAAIAALVVLVICAAAAALIAWPRHAAIAQASHAAVVAAHPAAAASAPSDDGQAAPALEDVPVTLHLAHASPETVHQALVWSLADRGRVPWIDSRALADRGRMPWIDGGAPLTRDAPPIALEAVDMPLHQALDGICAQLAATWYISRGTLVIGLKADPLLFPDFAAAVQARDLDKITSDGALMAQTRDAAALRAILGQFGHGAAIDLALETAMRRGLAYDDTLTAGSYIGVPDGWTVPMPVDDNVRAALARSWPGTGTVTAMHCYLMGLCGIEGAAPRLRAILDNPAAELAWCATGLVGVQQRQLLRGAAGTALGLLGHAEDAPRLSRAIADPDLDVVRPWLIDAFGRVATLTQLAQLPAARQHDATSALQAAWHRGPDGIAALIAAQDGGWVERGLGRSALPLLWYPSEAVERALAAKLESSAASPWMRSKPTSCGAAASTMRGRLRRSMPSRIRPGSCSSCARSRIASGRRTGIGAGSGTRPARWGASAISASPTCSRSFARCDARVAATLERHWRGAGPAPGPPSALAACAELPEVLDALRASMRGTAAGRDLWIRMLRGTHDRAACFWCAQQIRTAPAEDLPQWGTSWRDDEPALAWAERVKAGGIPEDMMPLVAGRLLDMPSENAYEAMLFDLLGTGSDRPLQAAVAEQFLIRNLPDMPPVAFMEEAMLIRSWMTAPEAAVRKAGCTAAMTMANVIGGQHAMVITGLIRLLDDPDAGVRAAAAGALQAGLDMLETRDREGWVEIDPLCGVFDDTEALVAIDALYGQAREAPGHHAGGGGKEGSGCRNRGKLLSSPGAVPGHGGPATRWGPTTGQQFAWSDHAHWPAPLHALNQGPMNVRFLRGELRPLRRAVRSASCWCSCAPICSQTSPSLSVLAICSLARRSSSFKNRNCAPQLPWMWARLRRLFIPDAFVANARAHAGPGAG